MRPREPAGVRALLVAAALFGASAHATQLTEAQAARLYATAFGQVNVAPPAAPPTIHFTTQAKLREMLGCERCPVRAFTRRADIWLDETLDFSDRLDASVLLHEYVHYLQWSARGEVKICEDWAAREREAYRIQAAALERIGVDSTPVRRAAFMIRCR